MNREDAVFPFTAVVNQEQVKTALLLNAVSHRVGGVLIRGRRGTAKSTLARGLAQLLPEIDVVADCPFSCDPNDIESLCDYCSGRLAVEGSLPVAKSRMKMVTLPLNATEEMVVGTIDIEKALRRGEKCFEPGILAKANRSILYVDEVNLLEDHIVDVLLDSAAMGVNVVEREGISFRHSARFILIGTMNPEEGDLRPQLEDRFGLCAEVDEEFTPGERAEILKRTLQFGRNPFEFESCWHQSQESVRRLLATARERNEEVEIADEALQAIAYLVSQSGADGHRADISMLHAARALAAFEGDEGVELEHISRVAELALQHRLRKGPLGIEEEKRPEIGELLAGMREGADARSDIAQPSAAARETEDKEPARAEAGKVEQGTGPSTGEFDVAIPEREISSKSPGRRGERNGQEPRGRYYRSAAPRADGITRASDVAFDATIRASASRGGNEEGRPVVLPEDLRIKMRKRKCGSSLMFVVDASASMGARKRLEASREAILSLLVEAYQKRDRVGLIVFKNDSAQLVLRPTSSVTLANRLLEDLSPGGTTPLSHGLALAYQVLDRELSRNPRPSPVLVLVSDGGGNVTMGSGDPMSEAVSIAREISSRGIKSVTIDSSLSRAGGPSKTGRSPSARRIAEAMGGEYFFLRRLTGDTILEKVAGAVLDQADRAATIKPERRR